VQNRHAQSVILTISSRESFQVNTRLTVKPSKDKLQVTWPTNLNQSK